MSLSASESQGGAVFGALLFELVGLLLDGGNDLIQFLLITSHSLSQFRVNLLNLQRKEIVTINNPVKVLFLELGEAFGDVVVSLFVVGFLGAEGDASFVVGVGDLVGEGYLKLVK